jgi:hypothetical protein
MKLTQEKQERVRAFVYEQARPLEGRLLSYYVGEGAAGDVLAELAKYQNPDGGFGRALEPDLRLPDSSAYATTVGLQILREMEARAGHPLVQGAIGYLLNTYDATNQVWPIIPSHDNRAPHAPWWRYDEDLSQRWEGFLGNPRAEIVGYLWDYAALVPENLQDALTTVAVSHLEALPDAVEMHELQCYMRLAETRTLPEDVRSKILQKLRRAVDCTVVRDPSEWGKYGLKPLDVVASLASPFAGMLAEEIDLNLDYVIEHQGEDGSWAPTWTWGDAFPEAWQDAEREWRGRLTVQALRVLRNFDRLE